MVEISALVPVSPLGSLGDALNHGSGSNPDADPSSSSTTHLSNTLLATISDTSLCEINSLFIASLGIPARKRQALNRQLQKHWGISFPDTGTCVHGSDTHLASAQARLALFGLQQDQCLMLIDANTVEPSDALSQLRELLGTDAYITDQTDSFVVLEVQGSLMLPAMERLCMLDLSLFSEGVVARTVMEHLSVIVERPTPDVVRLYSPRSSAGSFLEAVRVSIQNVQEALKA